MTREGENGLISCMILGHRGACRFGVERVAPEREILEVRREEGENSLIGSALLDDRAISCFEIISVTPEGELQAVSRHCVMLFWDSGGKLWL